MNKDKQLEEWLVVWASIDVAEVCGLVYNRWGYFVAVYLILTIIGTYIIRYRYKEKPTAVKNPPSPLDPYRTPAECCNACGQVLPCRFWNN